RVQGSIGSSADPGRVWKGKKMAGKTGADKVTLKNLSIVKIDEDQNLIYLKGTVPGIKGGFLVIKG
ncbi:MAG: 50S ribosomal protein L3, partial [candidate division WOR-3 bacterium]|nr:50S ribosomal protein L3 [candidate division WOR-3 bacterium]